MSQIVEPAVRDLCQLDSSLKNLQNVTAIKFLTVAFKKDKIRYY